MADTSYAAYEKWKASLGPAGANAATLPSFEDWQKQQTGGKATQVSTGADEAAAAAAAAKEAGRPARTAAQEAYYREHQGNTQVVSETGRSPSQYQYGYEENRLAGMFRGDETGARDAEIRKRRSLNANGPAGALALPPDLADIALRDISTGRQRRARGGSSSSALGLFNPTAPLTGVR